jgi:hypothetical protein
MFRDWNRPFEYATTRFELNSARCLSEFSSIAIIMEVHAQQYFHGSHRSPSRAAISQFGQVAQLVERSPEKAGVGGSIPSLATILFNDLSHFYSRSKPRILGPVSDLNSDLYEQREPEGASTLFSLRNGRNGKESRPALNRLMEDAQQCRFDAVLVWKIDRFGRSLKHLVNSLADLSAYGISFISLRDNLDLSTPSGRLMFQIIGAMAEFERALIQERVRAGLRNAKAKGKRIAHPQVKIDSSKVLELRSRGLSWRAISDQLGLGLGTVYRATHSHPKSF